jgi:hypothetical protein
LRRLRGELDDQRAAKKAETRYRAIELKLNGDHEQAEQTWADFWRWYAGNARFACAVNDKLAEARYLVDAAGRDDRRCRLAIEAHRETLLASGDEPTTFDEQLWATLTP